MCKVSSNIPIFISARGNNINISNKNKEALKYTYVLIEEMNMFNQTYIISDSQEMLDYAKLLGFKHFIYQECKTKEDIIYLDYIGIYNFYKKTGYKPDWFILLSINQLFRDKNLIYNCIRNIDAKYDVIASYTEISNPSSFVLDENNKIINGEHLNSSIIERKKIVDASIYAINTDFAIYIMECGEADRSKVFWNGKFKFFKNNSLYTDIYLLDDINKYNDIINKINKVKQLSIEKGI